VWRIRVLWVRLYHSLRPAVAEAELQREVNAHLAQMEDDHYRAHGAEPGAARVAARRAFGSIELAKENHRDARSFRWITDGLRDLRTAGRSLRHTPVATVIAILSLGLGLGAINGVYSTFDWLMNRPPEHVADPDSVVLLRVSDPKLPTATQAFSYDQFLTIQNDATPIGRIATFNKQVGVLGSGANTDQVVVSFVSGEYFDLLGVHPLYGRLLTRDDRGGLPIPVVLAHASFIRRFGSDPSVVGRSLRLGGNAAEVVGVLPPRFDSLFIDLGPTDVWVPLEALTALGYRLTTKLRDQPSFQILARLHPHDTAAAVEQRLTAMLPHLPAARKIGTFVPTAVTSVPLRETRVLQRDLKDSFFLPLLAVCGLVLLAACFNLSDFVAGRAYDRRGELALRAAVGASRPRLLWQLASEAVLIGLASVVVGAAVSIGVIYALSTASALYLQLPATGAAVSTTDALDARVLGSASLIGALCTMAFGVTPGIGAVWAAPMAFLRRRSVSRTKRPVRAHTRELVVAAEIALAVALSTVAALYASSFLHVARVDSGFPDADRVLLARLNLTAVKPADRSGFYDALRPALLNTGDVVDATIGWNPPHYVGHNLLWVPTHEDSGSMVGITAGAPHYFAVQRIPLLAGREFDGSPQDERSAIIINVPTARALWPGREGLPIGELIVSRLGSQTPRTVIGVVADTRCDDILGENRRCAWLPFTPTEQLSYLRIRTRGAPMAFAPMLRRVVHNLHPDAAIAEEVNLRQYLGHVAAVHRTAMLAATGLAIFAVVLVVVGVATVFTALVAQRETELAVRLALGAKPVRLAMGVIGNALAVATVGAAVGLSIEWRLADVIAPQLHHVNVHDPFLIVVALGVITVAATAAAHAGARAAGVEPAQSLRVDSGR
jgi:predicted permease